MVSVSGFSTIHPAKFSPATQLLVAPFIYFIKYIYVHKDLSDNTFLLKNIKELKEKYGNEIYLFFFYNLLFHKSQNFLTDNFKSHILFVRHFIVHYSGTAWKMGFLKI